MKSAKLLLLPALALLAGCASTPDQAKSAARPAETTALREVHAPVAASGGSSGLQQFRR